MNSNTEEENTAAVIGLGSMGLGMAVSLVRRGWRVFGCDVSVEARRLFEEAGGIACETPAQACAESEIALGVVLNASQTDAVLFGEKGAAGVLSAGSVFVSSTTMAPADAVKFASRLAGRGILYLDAPISGGTKKAAIGKLTVMASGGATAFDKAQPLLDVVAERVFRLGETPGVGSSIKMINQLLAGVHIAAACEAITLASKLGLDLPTVYDVIVNSAGNSWMFQDRVPHVLAGDYSPLSSVEIFIKDLGIIQDMARSERYPAPLAATALQMYLAAAGIGLGKDDDASIARVYAKLSGALLPSPRLSRPAS